MISPQNYLTLITYVAFYSSILSKILVELDIYESLKMYYIIFMIIGSIVTIVIWKKEPVNNIIVMFILLIILCMLLVFNDNVYPYDYVDFFVPQELM